MRRFLFAIWTTIVLLGLIPAEAEQVSWNENTRIDEVTSYPAFGDWGRMIFPVDTGYYSGSTLGSLRLTWYSNIQPAKTVEIVNYMREKADAGEQIFYRIYTDAEIAADPWKADTGLFFFKGNPGAKFAICNAGGGFAYVGAMHDSFPHALELSKIGHSRLFPVGRKCWCPDGGLAGQLWHSGLWRKGVSPAWCSNHAIYGPQRSIRQRTSHL